jgi:hypothetical protein
MGDVKAADISIRRPRHGGVPAVISRDQALDDFEGSALSLIPKLGMD